MGYVRLIPTVFGEQILRNIDANSVGTVSIPSKKLGVELMEEYKRNLPSKKNLPKKFQHPASDTYIIYSDIDDENSKELYRFKGKIKRRKLNKIISKYPKAFVLVDLGNGLYKKIPIKTFKKLTKIKFIIFERDYEFCLPDEFEHESMNAIWETLPDKLKDYIYSVNELLYVLTLENAYNKAIENFMMVKFYLLVGEEKVLKILYHDDTCEKITLENFMDKYKIDINVNFL